MSSGSVQCGFFTNTTYITSYGFASTNLLPSSTKTLTITWEEPESGVIFASSTPINIGSGYNFSFPATTFYYYFGNQTTWNVNVDLSTCYIGVIVYNSYSPIYFSIQIDGQALSIFQVISTLTDTSCCAEIGGYDSIVLLSNGLEIQTITCCSFGQAGPGTSLIPLGGACTCPGILTCSGCPTSGGTVNLYCPSSSSSSSNSTSTIPPNITSLSKTMSKFCSLSKFLNLPVLKPPSERSIISSTLWNDIVNNIYGAYGSLTRVLSSLTYLNQGNLLNEIYTIYDSFASPTPYEFTPILHASPGTPLTAKDFNALINALEEVYGILNESPPYSVSFAFGNSIVKSETFGKIVYDINFLRKNALQSILLLSVTGSELNTLPSTFAGQNVFVCSLSNPTTLSGFVTIENLFLYLVLNVFTVTGNTSITRLIVQNIYGEMILQDSVNIQNMAIDTVSGTIYLTGFTSVQNLVIDEISSDGKLILGGNAYVQNLTVNTCQPGSILVQNFAYVNSLGGQAQECVMFAGYES